MDRRGFLGSILAAAAAPAIVRIGSLMPVRSIVIPTTEEVLGLVAGSGNHLLTMNLIAREALRIAHERMMFIDLLNRPFDAKFSSTGTMKIRRPISYARS